MYTLRLLDITGTSVQATITDATILRWADLMNGPGPMVYTVPFDSQHAREYYLQKYKRLELSRSKHDGSGEDEVVWFGFIDAHKRLSPAEITVFCEGIPQLFLARFTAKDETFPGPASDEAFDLLEDTNDDYETGISTGDGGVASTLDVKAEGRKAVLGMLEEMREAHGAEYRFQLDRTLDFVPQIGEDKSDTVTLVYRTDEPGSNVEEFADGEDGKPLRNRIIGENPDLALESIKTDTDSRDTYGLLVDVVTFREAQDQPTLEALTQAHLDRTKLPAPAFEAVPILARKEFDIVTNGYVLTGFQYGVASPGDIVGCEIVSAGKSVTTDRRVVEVNVEVEDGKERVTFTLGDPGVFVVTGGGEVEAVKARLLALEQKDYSGSSGGGGGGSSSEVSNEVPSGTIDGVNTTFTLSQTPIAGTVRLVRTGARERPSTDFSVSGTTITFVVAPPVGSWLLADYLIAADSTRAFNEVPTGAIDGVNTTFTLANTPISGTLKMTRTGARERLGVEYSVSGTTVTFAVAPPIDSWLLADYEF